MANKEKKKKNHMYYEYFRNIPEMIKNWKAVFWVEFRGKCPICRGNKLEFVEGTPRFSKWFCTECTTMSYTLECVKCKHKHLLGQKYKPHIYKEYRLGKYKDDNTFFSECQKSYFKDRINFHKQGLTEWKESFETWKKRKRQSVLYSKG